MFLLQSPVRGAAWHRRLAEMFYAFQAIMAMVRLEKLLETTYQLDRGDLAVALPRCLLL